MKKLIGVFLISVFLLTACGGGDSSNEELVAAITAQAKTIEALSQSSEVSTQAPPENQDLPAVQPVASPTVLLYDDFDDPDSGWGSDGDQTTGEMGYSNGQYRIAFYQPSGFAARWSQKQYGDFVVETEFSVPSSGPNLGAGLTFRTIEKNWYLLWFYPQTREYYFVRDINGSFDELVIRTTSPAINPKSSGERLSLQLKVVVHDDVFEIWVAHPDGEYQFVNAICDTGQSSGYLGPSAYPPQESFSATVAAKFEWIRVTKYDSSMESYVCSAAGPQPSPNKKPGGGQQGGNPPASTCDPQDLPPELTEDFLNECEVTLETTGLGTAFAVKDQKSCWAILTWNMDNKDNAIQVSDDGISFALEDEDCGSGMFDMERKNFCLFDGGADFGGIIPDNLTISFQVKGVTCMQFTLADGGGFGGALATVVPTLSNYQCSLGYKWCGEGTLCCPGNRICCYYEGQMMCCEK